MKNTDDKYLEFARDYLDFCGIEYDEDYLWRFRIAVREDIQHAYNIGSRLFFTPDENYRKLKKSDINCFIKIIEMCENNF